MPENQAKITTSNHHNHPPAKLTNVLLQPPRDLWHTKRREISNSSGRIGYCVTQITPKWQPMRGYYERAQARFMKEHETAHRQAMSPRVFTRLNKIRKVRFSKATVIFTQQNRVFVKDKEQWWRSVVIHTRAHEIFGRRWAGPINRGGIGNITYLRHIP